ncbi:hypothetical protein BC829DRAFT_175893 [Chytridium lagenaria]|nr:hypothetical protein BC829DRAFT_175893 [Chytridium lagenaria]
MLRISRLLVGYMQRCPLQKSCQISTQKKGPLKDPFLPKRSLSHYLPTRLPPPPNPPSSTSQPSVLLPIICKHNDFHTPIKTPLLLHRRHPSPPQNILRPRQILTIPKSRKDAAQKKLEMMEANRKKEEEEVARRKTTDESWVNRIVKELKAQREWSDKWNCLNDPKLYLGEDGPDAFPSKPMPTRWSPFNIINPPDPIPSHPLTPSTNPPSR